MNQELSRDKIQLEKEEYENFNYYKEEQETFMDYITRIEEYLDYRLETNKPTTYLLDKIVDAFEWQLFNNRDTMNKFNEVITHSKKELATVRDLRTVVYFVRERLYEKCDMKSGVDVRFPWWFTNRFLNGGAI